MLEESGKLKRLDKGYESTEKQELRTLLFILSQPDVLPVCCVSSVDFTSIGLVCIFVVVFLYYLFDSLRPINNLSVIKGRVFLGSTSTKLGLMFLLKDTTQ